METSPNKVRIGGNARKILATLQNLLDRDVGLHKNWTGIKKNYCNLYFFLLYYLLASVKIQYGWFGECARLPNRGTANQDCQCLFNYIIYLF
ncbi:hypothetical protein C6503_03090 [Candidatus Poribacteria bacterium]|nr:MAG: hypothetical protein C6503_03090 [Candidatus Poribacteria bacterium]